MQLPLFDRPGDFIEGRFVDPRPPDGVLAIASPAHVHDCVSIHGHRVAHVDRAVEAARRAFVGWRRLTEQQRAQLLRGYQTRLGAHREAIALAIALEVGKALWEARVEVDSMIAKIDLALGAGARFTATESIDALPGEIRYRPLGVVAVIGPFNFPGHLPNGQIVPALLLGNCVVHKPSERTPSAGTWIARCLDEAGLPAGVFNLIQGPAASGRALGMHPGIDGVLFTGSAAVGQQIVRDNAAHPERLIALELGGKNAAIVLDDCDLERTARAIAFAAFATSGQRCTSTSRLIATTAIAEPLIDRVAEIARAVRVGHPLDPGIFMGPLISAQARARLLAAGELAERAGIETVVHGGAIEVPGREGFYVRPALRRARTAALDVPGYSDEELFGPDLYALEVPDLETAIGIANRSRFGLAASVFSRSRAAFDHAAAELEVGVVHWNRSSAGASGRLPFGGAKLSGNHRAAGILAGLTCAYPQAVLLEANAEGALPSWPGIAL
jgi:succinylglutamic semialdehyde dehydrogenase